MDGRVAGRGHWTLRAGSPRRRPRSWRSTRSCEATPARELRPRRPRLLALRLHGFKSFAERTVVEFGAGISAVVGPNGSGKSNLADALRWALGEQGRALRSRKSEDVIFAGSESRGGARHGRRDPGPRQRRRPPAGRLPRPRAGPAAVPLRRERLPAQSPAGPTARSRRPARRSASRRQRVPVHRPGHGRPGARAPARGAPAAVRGGGRGPTARAAAPAGPRSSLSRPRPTSRGSRTSSASSGRRRAAWLRRPSSRPRARSAGEELARGAGRTWRTSAGMRRPTRARDAAARARAGADRGGPRARGPVGRRGCHDGAPGRTRRQGDRRSIATRERSTRPVAIDRGTDRRCAAGV